MIMVLLGMPNIKAGCYYCQQIFDLADVVPLDDNCPEAACPKCGIDAIILYGLTPERLAAINKEKFNEGV